MTLVINSIAALVVFVHGLFYAVNSMGKETAHGMRSAWIALTTGALAALVAPLYGRIDPTWPEAGVMMGIAFYVVFDRRRRNKE